MAIKIKRKYRIPSLPLLKKNKAVHNLIMIDLDHIKKGELSYDAVASRFLGMSKFDVDNDLKLEWSKLIEAVKNHATI